MNKRENHFQLKSSLIIMLFALCFQSCDSKKQEAKSVVEEWNQKEIIIPKNLRFKSLGQDTICSSILSSRFKVLVYIDSMGCIACKLKLLEWKALIDTCKLKAYDVGFLFVVQSNKYNVFEENLSIHNFSYPIIYDPKGVFNKLNQFPKKDKYRTFLLDEKNRVIFIGSPITNKKIRKSYTEILRGGKISNINSLKNMDIKSSSVDKTSVQLNKDLADLGIFSLKTTKHINFQLKNTGKHPLTIQSVNTSCGCTVAKYDKKPITQGETTTVVLEYKPNSLGYFSKTADVVCNVPEGYIRLKISGEVVEK